MAENKFIERLQGKGTEKSVVEINNTATPTMFTNMPAGDSNGFNTYSDHRGNATIVANGTMNWKVDSLQTLTPANIVNGNGEDFTTSMATSGAGLWINAEYTFPSTGDPNHPVAMVFNPQTKWVLKVCGDNLLSPTSNTIDFTVLITFGSSNIISKTFTVAEQANKFCKEFVIDFAESNTNIIKAQGLSTMKLQLLCGTADASANIYGGMTVLTCLQRKVEAVAISSTFANVEEVLRDGLLPNDYFSNGAYIAQVTDGDTAYAVFQRDGDEMLFVGWNQPIPDQTGNSGKFLMTNGSLMSWEQLTISDVDGLQDDLDDLQGQITTNKGTMDNHIANTSNPHQVTKTQVGLGNVDNTSDLDKPISTATQNALDLKANIADLGTAAYTDSTDYATAAQGAKADTALQAGDNVSELTNDTGYITGADITGKVNKTGDTMSGNLEFSANAGIYLEGIGSAVAYSTSRLNLGSPSNVYAYLTGNNQGVFGIYSEASGTRKGIACYPNQNFFADAPTKTIDLGRSNNVWKIVYGNSISDGTNTETTANIISGASAGATAVQPSDLATVATSGSYNDLSNKPTIPAAQVNSDWNANSGVAQILNKPTLGTAAAANTTDFATAAQGALADTAVQPGDNVSGLTNDAGYLVMGDLTNFVTKNTAQTISGLKTFSADIVLSGTTSIKNTTGGVSYTMMYRDTSGIHVGTSTQALLLAGSGTHPSFNGNNLALLSEIPTVPTTLAELTGDVNISSPTNGQHLVYDGTKWKNQTSASTVSWGGITGSLSDQTDLKNALDTKLDAIDGATITMNSNDEIQAVGTVNQNTATGATNPIKSWLGDINEYNNQSVPTSNPDALCFIVDKTQTATDRYIVEAQYPDDTNGYTWYFLYSDGWVEQGQDRVSASGTVTVSFPVAMASTNYTILKTMQTDSSDTNILYNQVSFYNKTTTGATTGTAGVGFSWFVAGMAA